MKTMSKRAYTACLIILAHAAAAEAGTFPDANRPPPAGADHTFTLSQDYPRTLPAKVAPWESINFRTHPEDYMRAVLAYVLEGNIDPAVDWDGHRNAVRKWYHVPWMHRGRFPREPMRGLTEERAAPPRTLHPNQVTRAANWGVGLYNPRGGYQVGKVWADPAAPRTDNVKFKSGSVSVKLLFTSASVAEVPYLRNAKEWKANTTTGNDITTLRLLQIDIAVRDTDNSSRTGWIFGTFMYNGDAPGATVYDRMVPVGLMWGNDPDVTPSMVTAGAMLQQGWINPAIRPLMFGREFGWGGRVNGPVDNPRSSCLSCHSTAQRDPMPSMTGTGDETAMLPWFRNIKAGKLFRDGPEAKSLDYSMQLRVAIRNFNEAPASDRGGGDD